MAHRKALIIGISGQDGSYLARHLLEEGYTVFGTSRDAQVCSFTNLKLLEIFDDVAVSSLSLSDSGSIIQLLNRISPDEVYNLAGQSSVGLSFSQPYETMNSISGGTLNLLEAIRLCPRDIKFYNACSSECYGDIGNSSADENTPFQPLSPYAVAKASAFWLVYNYRKAYNLFACSGILFNHESPLRSRRFVTRKIVSAACSIAAGTSGRLTLGNLDISRDWGWAPEYVEAMWLMLQHEKPDDYIICTGASRSLEEFVSVTFEKLNLDWQDHVDFDTSLLRPVDITNSSGSAEKAFHVLGWKSRYEMEDVIQAMIDQEPAHSGTES